MTFTAGQKLRASDLNQVGVVVGRNRRTTNFSTTGAILRALSTTAAVVAGRSYRVTVRTEMFANTAPATSQNEVRYTTNNTEPLVTSPILCRALVDHRVSGVPDFCHIEGLFHATTTGTFRVALCIQRVLGAGDVASAANVDFPTFITVEDVGPTVSTTGTVY